MGNPVTMGMVSGYPSCQDCRLAILAKKEWRATKKGKAKFNEEYKTEREIIANGISSTLTMCRADIGTAMRLPHGKRTNLVFIVTSTRATGRCGLQTFLSKLNTENNLVHLVDDIGISIDRGAFRELENLSTMLGRRVGQGNLATNATLKDTGVQFHATAPNNRRPCEGKLHEHMLNGTIIVSSREVFLPEDLLLQTSTVPSSRGGSTALREYFVRRACNAACMALHTATFKPSNLAEPFFICD